MLIYRIHTFYNEGGAQEQPAGAKIIDQLPANDSSITCRQNTKCVARMTTRIKRDVKRHSTGWIIHYEVRTRQRNTWFTLRASRVLNQREKSVNSTWTDTECKRHEQRDVRTATNNGRRPFESRQWLYENSSTLK